MTAVIPTALADMLIQRDDSWNKKLYGSDVQPDDVLKGLVPRPPEVFPLFDTLQVGSRHLPHTRMAADHACEGRIL